jgi:hypothetical protein
MWKALGYIPSTAKGRKEQGREGREGGREKGSKEGKEREKHCNDAYYTGF